MLANAAPRLNGQFIQHAIQERRHKARAPDAHTNEEFQK